MPAVYRALKKQVTTYSEMIKQGRDISTHLFNEHIEPVIRRLYLDAGLQGARKMRAEVRSLPIVAVKRSSFGVNDEMVQAIIDYLQRYLLQKSVAKISETTRKWVLNEIAKGQAEGKSSNDIAEELAGNVFLKYQALRIVRTETVRAVNVGVKVAMDASPYEVQKEWVSAHDNRTRHSHRALDGQIRDIEEDFLPGLAQPGDPRAAAAQVCNCRCTLATVPKRDSAGRLVRKPVAIHSFLQTG